MAAIDFPASPSIGDVYTDARSNVWVYDGIAWQALLAALLRWPAGAAGMTVKGGTTSNIGMTAGVGAYCIFYDAAHSVNPGYFRLQASLDNTIGGKTFVGKPDGTLTWDSNTIWHSGNDGPGSGLDADLLDGQQGSYYLPAGSYTAADVLSKLLTVDGSGSGLDADTVDGVGAAAGTYTPTLNNTTNVGASTPYACQYLRVGNTVTVSGKVDIDPTAAGATVLGISLPIASAFSSDEQCGGTAALSGLASQENGVIYADATNDRAALGFYAVTTTNSAWFFTFTYRVI